MASGSTCKLGSHHPVLTTEQTEKSTTFPESIREGRAQGKTLPTRLERQTGKYKESQLTYRSRDSRAETTGTSAG